MKGAGHIFEAGNLDELIAVAGSLMSAGVAGVYTITEDHHSWGTITVQLDTWSIEGDGGTTRATPRSVVI